jgi:hypothetical protein
MEPRSSQSPGSRVEPWIALALCVAVLAARGLEQLVRQRPAGAGTFAPYWLPLATLVLAAAGIERLDGRPRLRRVQGALLWGGVLLMVWTANGLPLHLLRLTPLIPFPVDWPRLATQTLAFVAAIVLARLALARSASPPRPAAWYGYAAFVLALPYPVLRTWWAMGGTLGLAWPGAGGRGWAPWLACIPWLMAAALSLLLVSKRHWMPRRLVLVAGWSATAIVALVGPAACWALVTALVSGRGPDIGIAPWVVALFYGSWLLWAIAAGAATRAYQLRSTALPASPPSCA